MPSPRQLLDIHGKHFEVGSTSDNCNNNVLFFCTHSGTRLMLFVSLRNISLRNLSFATIYDHSHSPLSSVNLTYPLISRRRRRGGGGSGNGRNQVRSKVSNKEGRAIAKKERTLTFRYKQIEAYLTRKKNTSSRDSHNKKRVTDPVVRSILHSFLSPFPRDIYPE